MRKPTSFIWISHQSRKLNTECFPSSCWMLEAWSIKMVRRLHCLFFFIVAWVYYDHFKYTIYWHLFHSQCCEIFFVSPTFFFTFNRNSALSLLVCYFLPALKNLSSTVCLHDIASVYFREWNNAMLVLLCLTSHAQFWIVPDLGSKRMKKG